MAGILRTGAGEVVLRRKCWEVLVCLTQRPGVLLSFDELLDAVWPGVAVAPKTLTNVIGELRLALQDDPAEPRYIETVHRRGYRFIAPLEEPEPLPALRPVPSSGRVAPAATGDAEETSARELFIGRSAELASLRECFERALAGHPEIVLVAGEPGIGKTTLVSVFLAEVLDRQPTALADRVQCVEHHGAHEAYMPLLDAVGTWAASRAEPDLTEILRRYAPAWLVQVPWLASADERRDLERSLAGSGPGRMLREGVALFGALSKFRPIVLLVEDLHWSDPATLEFLAVLAKRATGARLLVVGTYRPVEALLREADSASLAAKLRGIGSTSIALEPFTRSDVRTYLEQRFPPGDVGDAIVDLVEERSGGNPLFVRAVCDHLVASGFLRRGADGWEAADELAADDVGLPDNLRDAIDAQLQLIEAPACEALEVAAVAGAEFDVDAVAAGLEAPVEAVDELLHRLARRGQIVRQRGSSARATPRAYSFAHAIYQRVLYERVPLRRRQRLHQRVGEALESLPSSRGYTAAELASHFQRSGDRARAVRHLEAAADTAGRHAASREMASYLEQALAETEGLPAGPTRDETELRLLVALQTARIHLGEADRESLQATHERVQELAARVQDLFTRYVALRALWLYWFLASDFGAMDEAARRALALAESADDPALAAQAHLMLGVSACFRGEAPRARFHLERGLESYAATAQRSYRFPLGFDLGVELRCNLGWALWLLGFPDRGLRCAQEGLELVPTDPNSRGLALTYMIGQHHLRGEWSMAHARAQELAALGEECGIDFWKRAGLMLGGWTLAEQDRLIEAMPFLDASGVLVGSVGTDIPRAAFLGRFALLSARMGNPTQALVIIDDALVRVAQTAGRASEPELYRIKGEVLVQIAAAEETPGAGARDAATASPRWDEAERCFQKAVALARAQGAVSWELRAMTSRSRLWQRRGRAVEAHSALATILASFTEGFDTADLKEARALLDELATG